MSLIDFIGFVAAILTTASFVPQAWHTFSTRDVSGISRNLEGSRVYPSFHYRD